MPLFASLNKSIIFSISEGCYLPMADSKIFYLANITFEACLLPADLQDITTGIKRCLFSKLLKYSEEAEGVILSFRNIKLLNQKSEVVDESPFIRFNVDAECLLFKPERGMELDAAVNMMGLHYIGLIVNGLFTATIPEDLMPENSSYDSSSHSWVLNGEETYIGATLRVKIDRIQEHNGMLSLICSMK